MKNYYSIILGRKSMYAEEAYKGNFISVGWLVAESNSDFYTYNVSFKLEKK